MMQSSLPEVFLSLLEPSNNLAVAASQNATGFAEFL
jgi:hypothetical protein